MSYVKCMVCGDDVGYINHTHLRKHDLTVAEYRQRYPQASLTSPQMRTRIRRATSRCWQLTSTRQFHRRCSCGRTFVTRCPKGRFCQRCSRANRQLLNKKQKGGTFDKNYLERTSDGRVRGAVLLEKGVSINGTGFFKGSKKLYWRDPAFADGFDYLIDYLVLNGNDYLIDYLVLNGEIYCGDCGSPVIIARENEHYSIPTEPCCKRCGLVYELT